MKVAIIREDGIVSVDGVARTIDLSTLHPCHAIHWDSIRGAGKVEYTYDDLIDVQVRDTEAEVAACEAARAAEQPEPTTPIMKTIQVRRPDLVLSSFSVYQSFLDAWAAAAPPPPPPPDPRVVEIDNDLQNITLGTVTPRTRAQLKAMTLAEFSTWFDSNFDTTPRLIGLLKRITLLLIRRVL